LHEGRDDPMAGTIFSLWYLASTIEAELQAAINAGEW
jgi:hypothetical protein